MGSVEVVVGGGALGAVVVGRGGSEDILEGKQEGERCVVWVVEKGFLEVVMVWEVGGWVRGVCTVCGMMMKLSQRCKW